ncbi:N-formylglutamate deformylase [Dyella sp.]|jgi:N-formylglutamate deformylase|uniref:N-formylglutamate deformylase n=1 Tax=Dyella sp. TaxID=1869338 RepID=UPI002D78B42B|nr:N-formylglutamate deformylase [Dyella sp.]HET6432098.1 N-formylglutamate deformylase [Dyella sp.]
MSDEILSLQRGDAPLLISLPHDGSAIPADIAARMRPAARRSIDTDWHVGQLYAPLAERLGASVLRPALSRYVVDLNRPEDGHALYPGQRETGLVPVIGFDGEPLYLPGAEPDDAEITRRVDACWRPYHCALAQELERLLAMHGRVVLWEGHSIRSRVPMLFDGRLPDFNLGTVDGTSCSAPLRQRLAAVLQAQDAYAHVLDGRFKGGYITRQYGRPDRGVQAVQLELSQCNYMDEDSLDYLPERAAGVQRVIAALLEACLAGV